ncbi:hypothetical protein BG011_008224 [Mortierella polycephala]|uniref:Uncharacterized protein n=1 Tax=Mortierella polycephala TaxID=41804 RepID=A0A9P6PND9_9FUNG|nr:hypothetical protein BG011_008224 [Mortierella polycephala]
MPLTTELPTPSISRSPSIAPPSPSQLAKQRNIAKPKITTPSPLSKLAAVRTTGNSSSAVAGNIQNQPHIKNTRGSVRNSNGSAQRKPAPVSKKPADQPRPARHPQTIPPKPKPSLEKKTPVKKIIAPTTTNNKNKDNGSSNNRSSRRSSDVSSLLLDESSPALILRFVTPARAPVPATTNPTDPSLQQTPQEDKSSPRAVVAVSFENAALTSQQMESFWEQHERDYAQSIHSVHSAHSANTIHNPSTSIILSSASPSSSSASTSSSSSSTTSLPPTTVQDPERDDASDRATIRSRTQSSPAHDLVAKIMERNAPQPQRSSIGGFMGTWTTKASSFFSSSSRKDTTQDSNNSNGSSSSSINTSSAPVISSLTASISPSLTKSLAVSVSSIESFPSQDPSSRRVRAIRDLFRASASAPQALEPQGSNRKEESMQEPMTSTAAPSTTAHTTEAADVTDKEEDKSDSRRDSLMSIFPVVFQKKTHLRVVTTSSSGQDTMHGSQSGLSTPLYGSEDASQNSSGTHSNVSSACPSPTIQQRIHSSSNVPIVQSPHAQQKKNASDEALATTTAQRGQRHVQERQEMSSCNTSEVSIATAKPAKRPALLPSMTMVNEIWHDHQPTGQKTAHEQGAYPTQQPNTAQAGETTTSSFRNTNESSEWPWMHPEKDKWNTTFVSAHKGLLLMPPTYSPASEMDDPIASYDQSPSGAPVSVAVITAIAGDTIAADAGAHGSLEAGVGARFGGPVGSLENNGLVGSKVSGHTYF